MILIIAEKPSLGRNIAAALGANQRGEGCLSGGQYIVTWAFGHLFSLADIEAYADSAPSGASPEQAETEAAPKKSSRGKKQTVRWTFDNLPCFPKEFRFELRQDSGPKGSAKKGAGYSSGGVKKQYEIIRALCRRADVDCIVNAGDADREGEIIVRLILQNALKGLHKPLKRLWLPDQTEQTIRAAAAQLEDEANYDNLANEGFARTYVDWLYGVNLTRYATLRTGKLLRVGRVIVPIVKAIYDRDMEIRNFQPVPYYAVISNAKTKGETVELVSAKKFPAEEKEAAEALCARYNAAEAVVVSVKKKKEILPPGKLYSLSKLQNVLGKRFKMSMDKSLSVLQKLYEEGYVTYPRTNSEYLATAEKEKIAKIIDNAAKIGYNVRFKDSPSIFDDSKIESHSALTPTYKIPAADKLSEDEMKVYKTIFRRFAAVFCAEDCVAEKSEMKVELRENGQVLEVFTLRGTVILEPGWMKYDDGPKKFKVLPALSEGDTVNTNFKPVEKSTEPPPHYTIETLNNYLKNPFREDKKKKPAKQTFSPENAEAPAEDSEEALPEAAGAADEEEYRAVFEGLELGTEATRTGIIDNARKSEYIKLTKDVYTILPDGEFLIESLQKMEIVMDKYKTSTLGRSLKRVFHGEDTVNQCVALAEQEISEIFAKQAETTVERAPYQPKTKRGKAAQKLPVIRVGTCPFCGKDVVRGSYAYGCMGYKDGCALRIGLNICGRDILPEEAEELLRTGKTPLLRGFTSKKGKKFDARLVLDNGKAVFSFDSPFPTETVPAETAPAETAPSAEAVPGDEDVPLTEPPAEE